MKKCIYYITIYRLFKVNIFFEIYLYKSNKISKIIYKIYFLNNLSYKYLEPARAGFVNFFQGYFSIFTRKIAGYLTSGNPKRKSKKMQNRPNTRSSLSKGEIQHSKSSFPNRKVSSQTSPLERGWGCVTPAHSFL